jgi:polyisoprenoid-binding protein YceI
VSRLLPRILIGVGVAGLLGLLTLVGVSAYSVLQPVPAPSGPIETVRLPAEAPAALAPRGDGATAPSSAPSTAAGVTLPETGDATTPATVGTTTFQIQQATSQARFLIEEVLRGTPITVVGKTNQVSGEIAVDPQNPETARVGTILINARTFTTGTGADDQLRDRAIHSRILETSRYEYITFEPTALRGLPATARTGETYTFQIDGKLTVHGVTRDVTFDAAFTATSDTELKGTASTVIRYADYNIAIPSVPFVTGIPQTVRLELDFTAAAV